MPGSSTLLLEVLKHGPGLKMSVFEQGEFTQTLRHYSEVVVCWEDVTGVCREITAVLNKAEKASGSGSALSETLKKHGQLLWDVLLSKTVKDRLKSTMTRDLVFSLDEELAGIPWELLYDGREFLSLKFNLGRLLHTKEQPPSLQYRSKGESLKMLILANPTGDLKTAYSEGLSIKNHFERKTKEAAVDFKSTNIASLYVKKNLRDYDIVHFAGHCEYDDKEPQNCGWVLNDSRFTPQDITSLSVSSPLPSLIFSNACHSAGGGRLQDDPWQERNYNLASAFLLSGVRHYIGTIRKIEDRLSLSFATEFYTRLINGSSVGASVRLARLRMIKEHGPGAISWGSYILYGDPGFSFFPDNLKKEQLKLKRNKGPGVKRMLVPVSVPAALFIAIFLYFWLPGINPGDKFSLKKAREFSLKGENEKALEIYTALARKNPGLVSVYPSLAQAYQKMGKTESALQAYYDYARYSEKKSDKHNLALAYISLGWLYQTAGEYTKAFDFYGKALLLSRESKDALNEAIALRKLSVWHMDKDNPDKAMELLMKSSEINRRYPRSWEHRYNLACDYFDIGLAFANKDDYAAAKEFYEKSRRLFHDLKMKDELSDVYFNLGEVYLFEKQYQKALESYLNGLKIDEAQANKPSLAADYNMLGELYAQMDDPLRAEDFFKKAISVSKEIKLLPELAGGHYNLALLYKKLGRKSKANEELRYAQEIYYSIDKNRYQQVRDELQSLNASP